MGLEFQVEDDKVCYTPLKNKCKAIQNLDLPKTLKQTRDKTVVAWSISSLHFYWI